MKKITEADVSNRIAYERAKPDALGNLHQRMKAVMEYAQEAEVWKTNSVLWHAIHDLQTEVQYLTPAKPPYGKRLVSTTGGLVP